MGDLTLFLPEATVLLGALVAFCASVTGASAHVTLRLSFVFAGLAIVAVLASLGAHGEPFFPGVYRVDAFSQAIKLGVVAGLGLTLMLAGDLTGFRERARPEIPMFLFISSAGMMMLASATELLTLYVSLELSSYGLYILAALSRRQRTGSEASAKYILYAAASSAVTLYGISMIFGAAGSTDLGTVVQTQGTPVLIAGMILALSGVLFKLAAFPFHAWAPDTYQGAPHVTVAFIATASKVAAVGALARIAYLAGPGESTIGGALLFLCVASMAIGNLAAIAQDDLKRLLAYSTVAHAGYLLIGLGSMSGGGVAAAIYYVLVYVPIVFAAFVVVCALGRGGVNPTKASLAGLYSRSPLLALTLMVGMFALAGIPPTAGFAGKWFVFTAAIHADLFWLVLVGAANATVSLYYYLRVVKEAYLTPPGDLPPVHVPPMLTLAAWVAMALIILTGVYPRPVWELAERAAAALVGS